MAANPMPHAAPGTPGTPTGARPGFGHAFHPMMGVALGARPPSPIMRAIMGGPNTPQPAGVGQYSGQPTAKMIP